ncbi:DUF3455 domain-containing protein [Roseateles depolymerans]|uniref:Uncharacterized protein n=1 Tax=Roseateles depolymerans TaxID=76731 RepID=A0A0U3NFH0_9BURK|nr:hypothetical protein RD2015_2719 [Roseateles depolymerans]REG20167.1 uncharacterized protein DUF3455 [Roseateles depolymerans]
MMSLNARRIPFTRLALPLMGAAVLSACAMSGNMGDKAKPMFSQASLPAGVQVPEGHRVALETVGVGTIDYECRAKKDMAGQFEWVFVGPSATLMDRQQQTVGKYYGPPATWEAKDGSKVTGTQVAVAPASPGNIPLQLVKANPAMGAGAMQGVSYIQRVATQGGVAPTSACDASTVSQRKTVNYQADYIFWTVGAAR